MTKTISRALFYLLAAVAVAWSASLSFSFLTRVLIGHHWLMPLAGLVIAELGAIGWSTTFIHQAAGTPQRSTALVMTVASLAAVAVMTAAEILTGGQSIATAPPIMGDIAVYTIAVLTAGNVVAVVVYHLMEPGNRRKMAIQNEQDQLFNEALVRLREKRVSISGRVSDEMANGMLAGLLSELATGETGNPPTVTPSPPGRKETTIFSMNQDGETAPKVTDTRRE